MEIENLFSDKMLPRLVNKMCLVTQRGGILTNLGLYSLLSEKSRKHWFLLGKELPSFDMWLHKNPSPKKEIIV